MTADANPETRSPSPGVPDAVRELAGELVDAFRSWEEDPAPWPEARFRDLALRAFRLQHEHVAPYRRYCEARGVDPREVEDWREIPPVPTAAFREVELAAGDPAAAPLVFRTSGTTRGRGARGRHPVLLPGVYRASLEAAFRRFVLDGDAWSEAGEPSVPLLSLVPRYAESDASSLSWMVDAVRARFGAAGSLHAAGSGGIDGEAA